MATGRRRAPAPNVYDGPLLSEILAAIEHNQRIGRRNKNKASYRILTLKIIYTTSRGDGEYQVIFTSLTRVNEYMWRLEGREATGHRRALTIDYDPLNRWGPIYIEENRRRLLAS